MIFEKLSLSTAGSSTCRSKELSTSVFTALLVVVVLHRLSCYKAQVDGFLQVLRLTSSMTARGIPESLSCKKKKRERKRENLNF